MEISPEMLNQPKYNPWYYYHQGKLVKKRKPCQPGDYIHINKWDGCYLVHDVKINKFVIKKNNELVSLPWETFRCLKGQGCSDMALIKKELRRLGSSLTGNVFQVNKILKMLNN
tara:strand:- start:20 stop:361 length:342 start_codon:yes stop_codon:yes gene_type:complete